MYPSRDSVTVVVQQRRRKKGSGRPCLWVDISCPVMDRDLHQVGKQMFRWKKSGCPGLAPVVQHSVDSFLLMSLPIHKSKF